MPKEKIIKKIIKSKIKSAPKSNKTAKPVEMHDRASLQLDKTKISKSAGPQTMAELLAKVGEARIKSPKRGDVVEATITGISKRMINVDIGGKTEGVVVSKEVLLNPELAKELQVGEKVRAYVVLAENDRGQVVVSLRSHGLKKKWDQFLELRDKGTEIQARGKELLKGGLLCDYARTFGFLPFSLMSPDHLPSPESLINRELKVVITEVDSDKHRLIFSEVGPSKTPSFRGDTAEDIVKRKDLAKSFKLGQTYECEVTAIAPYGLFVAAAGEKGVLEGLIHISEIAWERIADLKKRFKINDKVQASLMGIDEKSGKLNLSIRNLLTNPWEEIAQKYPVDTVAKGVVVKVTQYGLLVSLEGGKNVPEATGMLHISKIPAGLEAKEGETIQVTVESVDTVKRRINLGLVLKEKPMGYK